MAELTQLSLLAHEGSQSPSEISRSGNEDGSVTVTIRLRDGIFFADGAELTADDLIFTYYVLLDGDYDGPYQLRTLPVRRAVHLLERHGLGHVRQVYNDL